MTARREVSGLGPVTFAFSLFGILIALRAARVYRERAVLGPGVVGAVVASALAGATGIRIWFGDASSWAWAPALAPGFLPIAAFAALERARVAALRERLPRLLDRWSLNLRLGNSVTVARDRALADEPGEMRALLAPVFGTRGGERAGHLLLSPSLRRELESISREPFSAVARLDNLRRGVRRSAEFRRKSGQAVRQTRIQSGVMLALVFAFSAYTLARYGWARMGDLVSLSILLSSTGVAAMVALGRKRKWKV